MRVLVTANAAWGHVNPLLPIVRAAQHRGAEVVLATGPDLAAALAARGITTWPVGPGFPRMLSAGSPEPPPDADPVEQAVAGARALFGAPAAARAAELVPMARAWSPDLVVSEMAEFAGAVVAADLGVAHLVHGYGPLQPGVAAALDAVAADLADAFGLPHLPGRLHAAPFADVCPPSLRPPGSAVWSDVRPVRPSPGEVLPGDALPPALADLPHEQTVYVTLGTLFNDPALLGTVVGALAPLEVNLVVTTGGVPLTGAFPSTVLVADHLPQALLLPRVSAVVSHAGAGTLLGSLYHGLPQVLLPQMPEQASNAATAARRGVAVALGARPTADAVRQGVESVLHEPGYGSAAREVAAEIARMPTADAVLAGVLGA
jgi:UDP:flavonoid glycosyltransferase YjiC (YdhE family)